MTVLLLWFVIGAAVNTCPYAGQVSQCADWALRVMLWPLVLVRIILRSRRK